MSAPASRYELLADRRAEPRGRFQWVASDFVLVEETERRGRFELSVLPADQADCPRAENRLEGDVPLWKRTLTHLEVSDATGPVTYRADAIAFEQSGAVVTVPWGARGIVVDSSATVAVETAGLALVESAPEYRLFQAERWFVAIAGSVVLDGQTVTIGGRAGAVVAVGSTLDEARLEITRLCRPEAVAESATAWNSYLDSCPIVEAEQIPSTPARSDLVARQLWHWRAARANVVRSIADPRTVFIAPDRARWLGSWSSDAPVTMAALAMTSQREVAVEVFLRYLRASLTPEGWLPWYTHPDGVPCLGRLGDTGVMSHGLPDVVWAAEVIDRHVPGVADMPGVRGRTVIETLRWYLASSDVRDVNGDGLWETSNLWEGAWDDKPGPMFREAPIAQWVAAMSSRSPEVVGDFLARYRRPSTTMVEQAAYVRAHRAFAMLSDRQPAGADNARWARTRADHAIAVVRERHWRPESGTYRDWDVVGESLNDADCLDGFYFLEFETDPDRQRRLIDALEDPTRFGVPRPPTLARDDPRYVPDQYWDGSYWPREMAYVAPGLAAAGRSDLAERVLVEAIESGEGCEILEHINSGDGSLIGFHEGGAIVYTQAMSVGLCLALIAVAESR